MLSQLYQSYMWFAWGLYAAFWVVVAVYAVPVSWFIAFGKGTYTIKIGNFVILKLENVEDDGKQKQ